MRTINMFFISAVMGFGILLVGCQTPGILVSEKDSPVCPSCKAVTKTSSVKGLNYTKYLCPTCKTEYDDAYTGDDEQFPEVVHTCKQCAAVVEECEICTKLARQL